MLNSYEMIENIPTFIQNYLDSATRKHLKTQHIEYYEKEGVIWFLYRAWYASEASALVGEEKMNVINRKLKEELLKNFELEKVEIRNEGRSQPMKFNDYSVFTKWNAGTRLFSITCYLPDWQKRSIKTKLWDFGNVKKFEEYNEEYDSDWEEELILECEKALNRCKQDIYIWWLNVKNRPNYDELDSVIYGLKVFMGIGRNFVFTDDEFDPEEENCPHYDIWNKWDGEEMTQEAEERMNKWVEDKIVAILEEEPAKYLKHKKFINYLETLDGEGSIINLPREFKRSRNSGLIDLKMEKFS